MKIKINQRDIVRIVVIGAIILVCCIPSLRPNLYGSAGILFIDKTDKLTSTINAQQVIDIPNMGNGLRLWEDHTLQVQTLSNYEYNTAEKMHLDNSFILFSNPKNRTEELEIFKGALQKKLDAIYANDTTKDRSSIYFSLMSEANKLRSSKAKIKYMIVQSDLQNNDDDFSIYRKSDYELLQSNPDKIVKRFTDKVQPDNLQGIDIYFVYEPKNDEDNKRFIMMVNLFKKIFESHNAQVYIGASLIPQKN